MNAKLLSAVVVGLVVVASLSPATQAIGVSELNQLLKEHNVEGLMVTCKSSELPVKSIKLAYEKILLVYSDDAKMTERAQKNQKAFLYAVEHPDIPDYDEAIKAHSDRVCAAIRSFYQRIQTPPRYAMYRLPPPPHFPELKPVEFTQAQKDSNRNWEFRFANGL